MLRTIVIACVVLLASRAHAQAPAPPAVDVTGAGIKAFIDQLPKDRISDLPIRVADVGGYKVGVYGVFRPKAMPGGAIRHQTSVTEVYYMLEGGASRHVVPGDVVIIPGNSPHWWSRLDSDIRYLIVRPDPEGLQPVR